MVSKGLFYDASMVLFPLIENSLRGLFVCANSIPSARMTAESDTLCLSLDIIMAENIIREQYIIKKQAMIREDSAALEETPLTWGAVAAEFDSRNEVFRDLGSPACNAIFDVLVWADSGYRLRDQLAHATADPETISLSSVSHTVRIVLGLLRKFSCALPRVDVAETSLLYLNRYQPCFHPKLSAAVELRAFQEKYERLRHLDLSNDIFEKLRAELVGRDAKLKAKDDEFQALLSFERLNLNRLSTRLGLSMIDVSSVPLLAPTKDAALSLYALVRQMTQILTAGLDEARRFASRFANFTSHWAVHVRSAAKSLKN